MLAVASLSNCEICDFVMYSKAMVLMKAIQMHALTWTSWRCKRWESTQRYMMCLGCTPRAARKSCWRQSNGIGPWRYVITMSLLLIGSIITCINKERVRESVSLCRMWQRTAWYRTWCDSEHDPISDLYGVTKMLYTVRRMNWLFHILYDRCIQCSFQPGRLRQYGKHTTLEVIPYKIDLAFNRVNLGLLLFHIFKCAVYTSHFTNSLPPFITPIL